MRTASRSTSGTSPRNVLAWRVRALAVSVATTALTKLAPPAHKVAADDAIGTAQLHALNSMGSPHPMPQECSMRLLLSSGQAALRGRAKIAPGHEPDFSR